MHVTRDTYEFEEMKEALENIEWDDIWRQDANAAGKKRILVIGDSISRGYRNLLIDKIGEEYAVDNIATSKAADNAQFLTLLDYMKQQSPDYAAVQFNNGLHGWHLSQDAYQNGYLKIVRYIKSLYPQARLLLALTTPLREAGNLSSLAERNALVAGRNRAAKEIAGMENADIIDLYQVIENRFDLYQPDGVHLCEEGYELLAEECAGKYRKE